MPPVKPHLGPSGGVVGEYINTLIGAKRECIKIEARNIRGLTNLRTFFNKKLIIIYMKLSRFTYGS